MRNFIVASIAVLAAAVCTVSAHAQQVAVLDHQTVMRDVTAALAAREQAEKQKVTLQAELTRQENDVRAADQDLTKQRPLLAPEAWNQRRRDLDKRISDLQQQAQLRNRQLNDGYSEAMRKVEKAMVDVVAEYAVEKKLELVVTKGVVLYAGKTLDITGEVVKRVNKKLPTVAVEIPK